MDSRIKLDYGHLTLVTSDRQLLQYPGLKTLSND